MPAPKATITLNEFAALMRRSGLSLTGEQVSELYAAYGYVEVMAERVRAGGNRPREAEPALVFNPIRR